MFLVRNIKSVALPYLLVLIVFFILAKEPMKLFSQRMSSYTFCLFEGRELGKGPDYKSGSFPCFSF